jgi:hypothetical protein
MPARPSRLHDHGVGKVLAVGFELFGPGQGLAHLTPVPAFHQRDAAQRLFTAHQHAQQASRRDPALQLIAAGPDLPGLPGKAKPPEQRRRMDINAGLQDRLRHAPRRGARLDRQIHAVGVERQRLVQPPGGGTRQSPGDQQPHDQYSSHNPATFMNWIGHDNSAHD